MRGEEAELWRHVAAGVTPLRPVPPAEPPPPPRPVSEPVSPPLPEPPVLSAIGAAARRAEPLVRVAMRGEAVTPLDGAVPGLDRRSAERLRRGRTEPEARIDLHGHTAEEAHGVLSAFVRRCHGQGLRVVLVITGKGRAPEEGHWAAPRRGVLRESVPRWLSLPPLAPLVAGVYPAHVKHGGGGALYVHLKRRRG